MSDPAAALELGLLDVLRIILRRWRTVVTIPLALAAVTAVVSLGMPPAYTASVTFVPEAGRGARIPAGLAGLAGQMGLSLGSDASRSPRFYASILKSRELLESTLLATFARNGSSSASDSARLLELLRIRGRTSADSLAKGVLRLGNLVRTSVDQQTAIVRLNVTMGSAHLAAAVANRMLENLNQFNTETRQSQARERRRFTELRVGEAETGLRASEADLRAFYERNRTWQQSPHLMFEESRLRRQLDIRQEVYLTLTREFETARIEEVNDTPVITVIDAAVPPQLRSKPRRKLMVLAALAFGSLVAAASVLAAERLGQRT